MNIILAHGYLGFNVFLGFEYFNGVKEKLEAEFGGSLKVFISQVSRTASIRERAEQLSKQIHGAIERETLDPARKAHIIAHSMGGLDARCMISQDLGDIASRILSLTTIGTPHLGSQIADLIIAKIDGKNLAEPARIREELLRAATRVLDIPLDGLRDLTTHEAASYDQRYPDRDGVRYFYIAGRGRDGLFPTCGPLLLAHMHIKEMTGSGEDNDGLVSVSSAARGSHKVEIWPADHADEIGHNFDILYSLTRPVGFDHFTEYCSIVERLATMEKHSVSHSASTAPGS